MKSYLVLILLIIGVFNSVAQDEVQDKAFFKIVNLIDTGKDSVFSLNGYTFKRGNPVPSGFSSGAFKLEPGSHVIEMWNEGAKKKKHKVDITALPGSNQSIVFYSEKKKAKDSNGREKIVYEMRHSVIEGQDEIGEPKLTIFSLCSMEELNFAVRKTPYKVSKKRPIEIPVKVREVVSVTKLDGTLIGSVEILSPFHYVGFIDDNDPEGKLRFTFLEHRKYVNISNLEEQEDEENQVEE